jgi:hypothetical protein
VVRQFSATGGDVTVAAGNVYTVAGDGRIGFAGDGGQDVSAVLDLPADVTAINGGLVIADSSNYGWGWRIRQVSS